MAAFKLIIFLTISMAFVLSVRCQDEYNGEIETELDKASDGSANATIPDKKGGFVNCVKEKVKKVVDRGKEVIKAAGDAISKGYHDFKAKTKEIIGKKQPETISPSLPTDPNEPPKFTPIGSLPPSAPIPGQQNSRSEPTMTEDQYEIIDPRQTFTK